MDEHAANEDVQAPATSSRWRCIRDALFLAGLVVIIAYAYAPSLEHAHRADQWFYFLDTMDCDGFGETLQKTYSHNRMITSKAGGDRALFRPVLFAVLAAERTLFGYEPRGWHVVGIMMHSVVVVLFFILARTLIQDDPDPPPEMAWSRLVHTCRRWAPHALTVFFALNFAIVEQVIWSHVNSYMLFLALLLGTLLLLFRLRTGQRNRGAVTAVWVLLLVAAFTYEIGQVVAVLAAGYLFFGRKTARPALAAAVFCCIPLVYQTANQIDAFVHRVPWARRESLWQPIVRDPAGMAANAGFYAQYVGLQPFDSGKKKASEGHRLRIEAPDYANDKPDATTIAAWGLLAALLAAGLFSIGRDIRRNGWWREPALRLGVLGGILALYAAAIVVGRIGPRGRGVLAENSYYTYPALCLLLLIVGLALSEAQRLKKAWVELAVAGLVVVLAGRALIDHVAAVRTTNRHMREWSAHELHQVRRMLAWIEEHRDEPDFSLAFDTQPCGAVAKVHGIAKLWVIARQWTRGSDSKYVVVARRDRLELMTPAEYDRRLGDRALRPFVELIEAASTYNMFRYGDRYHGLPFWEGTYDPRRDSYQYLVEGPSPGKVRAQHRAMHRRQAEDMAAGRLVVPTPNGLILEGYKGYNVIVIDDHYYGVRQDAGEFNVEKQWRGELQYSCDAPDFASVKRRIDAIVLIHPVKPPAIPHLVERNYRGYNIIRLADRYYAIRQNDGAFDVKRFRRGGYRESVEAADVPGVKHRIRDVLAAAGRANPRF